MAIDWGGILSGAGRGLSSAVDTYARFKAFQAARDDEEHNRALRAAQLEEQRRRADQDFQLDQRRLNASVTEMGNKQRAEDRARSARRRMLQGIATTDRGELGEALRAAALAGGGQNAYDDIDPDELSRLMAYSSRETPEERAERERRNIELREQMQQKYSERLVAAAAGGATNRQTPDQMAAREEVRHAQTNVRGADRDFRRVMGRKPVVSSSAFKNALTLQPDTAAYSAALDAWRADSADADQTRQEAREDLQAAERVRDQLFPGLGRTAAAVQEPPPAAAPAAPAMNPAVKDEFAKAAERFRRLLDAGADPAEARSAYSATIQQIARRYGLMR